VMSRRQRAGVIGLCLLIAAVFIYLDHSSTSSRRQGQSKSSDQTKSRDIEKYDGRTFTVVKAVDGDTIDINSPDCNKYYTRIRLWGVDTPETKSPKVAVMYFGPEASEFTKGLVFQKKVCVYLDETNGTRDKYGRLLAYIQTGDSRFLNEVLLSEGYAYADLRFKHKFYNKYQQLEAGARREKKGLWKGVSREQLPEWLQRKKPKLLLKK